MFQIRKNDGKVQTGSSGCAENSGYVFKVKPTESPFTLTTRCRRRRGQKASNGLGLREWKNCH